MGPTGEAAAIVARHIGGGGLAPDPGALRGHEVGRSAERHCVEGGVRKKGFPCPAQQEEHSEECQEGLPGAQKAVGGRRAQDTQEAVEGVEAWSDARAVAAWKDGRCRTREGLGRARRLRHAAEQSTLGRRAWLGEAVCAPALEPLPRVGA